MIKVNNPKSLIEIEELREKGLYNAPFSVLEAVDISKFKSQAYDDSELVQRLDLMELDYQEFMVSAYEEIARVELEYNEAIVAIYENLGGM